MKSSSDYMFCATLFLLTAAGVTGLITNPPLNAIVEVGVQAMFNCTSSIIVQSWVFSRTREEFGPTMGQDIAVNCVVQPAFTTHYEVDRPGGSNYTCNLIVKDVTMQQAGVYTCTDTGSGNSSILTVIDRDASITTNSTGGIVAGDTVTMSYSVRYNTSTAAYLTPTIQPVLSWTDPDGKTVARCLSSAATSVTSSISVTAGRQDIRPYSCRINYEIIWPSPSTGVKFANNIPDNVHDPIYSPTINNVAKDSEDESTSGVSGLSVGLFKRNNVIILMVGIAVLLLIGSKGTSGV